MSLAHTAFATSTEIKIYVFPKHVGQQNSTSILLVTSNNVTNRTEIRNAGRTEFFKGA